MKHAELAPLKTFEQLQRIIETRRTCKVDKMNGEKIPSEWIHRLLSLGDAAPTHGRTEPWRFFVFEGSALKSFCETHAALYWDNTPEEQRQLPKYNKLKAPWETASHLIITVMRRTADTKIPAEEEYAATAAAIQNILLGSRAMGLASIWSTGGMTHHTAMKAHLKLGAEDKVLGLIFLGFRVDSPVTLERRIPLEEKTIWSK